jgi:hypothetical protein
MGEFRNVTLANSLNLLLLEWAAERFLFDPVDANTVSTGK